MRSVSDGVSEGGEVPTASAISQDTGCVFSQDEALIWFNS